MLRTSFALAAAAIAVASCEAPPEAPTYDPGWRYTHLEDKLRNRPTVEARLGSNEHYGFDPQDQRPVVSLTVRKGTPDGDGVEFSSLAKNCGSNVLIRVDDYPITRLPCDEEFYAFYSSLPLESELAQRIIASKRLVVELPALGVNTQVTFNTEGLRLDTRS